MGKQITADERCEQDFGLRKADGWIAIDLADQRKWNSEFTGEKRFGPAEPQKDSILRDRRYLGGKDFSAKLQTAGEVESVCDGQVHLQILSSETWLFSFSVEEFYLWKDLQLKTESGVVLVKDNMENKWIK